MALYDESATLVRLSDTSLTVQDPAEDVRSYKMVDKDGKEIGEVNELLIDERDKKVRFLEAESGGDAWHRIDPIPASSRYGYQDRGRDRPREPRERSYRGRPPLQPGPSR